MRNRTLLSLAAIVSVLAIAVGVNMLAGTRLADARLDLTQGHIYTLSPGTRQILRGLKQRVTLRLFYSPTLGQRIPAYGAYHDQVVAMLKEFATISHGRVRVEQLDPTPFSATEDRAIADGLQGVPVDESGARIYFGIAGSNMLDDQKQIAFLDANRQRFLEYDLAKLVHSLSDPQRPVVGVMSSLPLNGNPRMMMMSRGTEGRPWVSMLQLQQSYDVRPVSTTATVIDPSVKVLLVAQAQHLSQATLYAIDQFVMRGGRLMVMVDPVSEAEAATPGPGGQPPSDTASDLHKLFDAWGIAYDPNQVVGDLDNDWRVQATGGERVQAVDYVPWFNIRDGIDHADPATGALHQITVASPGFIAKKPGAAISFTPLLTTSARAGLIPAKLLRADTDPATVLADFKPDGKQRVIAARVRGVLHSAFSGPPPATKGEKNPPKLPPYRAHTDGPADLVVVADSDILADRFWVRTGDFFGQREATPFSDNGAFVANLVGTLAGGDTLIGLRGRGDTVRPFDVVNRMRAEAEARYRRTEQALQAHLHAVEKQLRTLRQGAPGSEQVVITPAQSAAIEAARHDIAQTRTRLRAVQYELRRNISRLKTELLVLDIGAVPALLVLAALGLGLARRRRRARRPLGSERGALGAHA